MRRHHAWLFLAFALAACSSQDRTRLAVTVYSDLSIPLEIDALRVEVQGPTGAPQQVEYALASQTTEGKFTLPVQTILVPQGKKDDAFTVTASGIKDRNAIITRTARLSFIPGDARELIIFLNRDCYRRTCVGDKTCIAGDCVDNAVNSKKLPSYTTNVKGKAASPDASFAMREASSGDTSAGDTNAVDGLADGAPMVDARLRADGASDGQGDEAGLAQDAPDMTIDMAPDTSLIPSPDVAQPASDTALVSAQDSGPIILNPDTASPDSKPTLDTAWPTDSELASDTPLLSPDADVVSPDTAFVSPDTLPASPDTPVDVPCPPGCDPGAKRCGTSGIQTCGTLANGCTDWGSDQPCGVHQTCTGAAPAATCECNGSTSSRCPLAGNTTGNFCESTELLQSCNRDSDGCYYLGTPQSCSTAKPCSGDDGSASCSCGPTTAPCGTDVGTFCNASNTQVYSCSFVSGCMVTTPGDACPVGKPCVQTGASAAECTCPAVPKCDAANEMNQGYCSGNTAITCSADENNCQQASELSCLTSQTCQVSGGTASCECINTACLNPSGGTFSGQACDGEYRVITCGTVDSCPAITGTQDCSVGTVCRTSGETAQCLTALGWSADLGSSGSRSNTMLIGHPITSTATVSLERIGLIIESLPSDAGTVSVKIGIYNNADGARLTQVEGPIKVGQNELTPASPVQLIAGSTYWMFAVFSADLVYVSQSGTNGATRVQPFNYDNPLPESMSASWFEPGKQSNYYLLVSP